MTNQKFQNFNNHVQFIELLCISTLWMKSSRFILIFDYCDDAGAVSYQMVL